jgi:lipoprotein-releasing system permease protein
MNHWLPFEWIAAVRFLREGRLQTLFIIGGISIGVAVIVFMSAMLAGLEANFIKRVLTSQPQIQLIPPDQVARPLRGDSNGEVEDAIVQRPSQRILSIDQWPKIRDQLSAMPEITAVSPTMAGSALAVRGDASRAISLSGVEPESYFKIVRVPDYIVAGQARLSSEDIIVGIELAKNLGATVGDKLNISAASGASRVLTITGLVDLGNKGTNQRTAYVSLRTAQSLLGMIGGVTTIDLTVNDIYAAETLAQQIQAANEVEADSWIKTNAQFFTAVQAQKTSNTLIRAFVALSVAFGIAAVLVVSVIQRSREIGILRAMGTTRGKIMRVFLLQGGMLGFAGSLFGSAMGAVALIYWHAVARQVDGTELFPLILDRQLFIATTILATLTGLLAAMAPALRAAKLDPVVAIRG